MVGVLCSSPSCRAVAQLGPGELPRLVAVLTERGWSHECHDLDTEANWYCPRCKGDDDAAA